MPFTGYLRRERPAAVVAAMWPFTSLCIMGTVIARSRATTIVVEQNTLSKQYAARSALHRAALRASLAFTYRLADVRVAVSNGVAEDAASLSWCPSRRFVVLYNPLSIAANSAAQPDYAETAWGGWTGKRILRLAASKPRRTTSC